VVQEELDLLKADGPEEREVQRALNQYQASSLDQLESILGKANSLNSYYFRTGNPDYFNEDLSRYLAVGVDDIQAVLRTYLRDNGRVLLSVVPEGQPELAAQKPTSE
jgi:zinc protease